MPPANAAPLHNTQRDRVVGAKGKDPIEKPRHAHSLKAMPPKNLLTLNTIQTIIKLLKPIGPTRLDSNFHGSSLGGLPRFTSLHFELEFELEPLSGHKSLQCGEHLTRRQSDFI